MNQQRAHLGVGGQTVFSGYPLRVALGKPVQSTFTQRRTFHTHYESALAGQADVNIRLMAINGSHLLASCAVSV